MVDTGDDYFVRCEGCGLRTPEGPWMDGPAQTWNRRRSDGARALSLAELGDWHYHDDNGDAAVWIEMRTPRGLFAAVLGAGCDLGNRTLALRAPCEALEPLLTPPDPEEPNPTAWREVKPEAVGSYGLSWRCWDRLPTKTDMEETPWQRKRAPMLL